jgi:amino acid adenylation domain-containing protein
LNVERLRDAFHLVAERHPALRTVFASPDGIPVPEIEERPKVCLEELDVRSYPAATREREARAILESEARRPFDLGTAPLFRVCLVRLEETVHFLLLSAHSIVLDQRSADLLLPELASRYEALARRASDGMSELELPAPVPEGASPNGDSPTPTLAAQIAYWKRQLAGRLPLMELPADRQRPAIRAFHGACHRFALDTSRRGHLGEFSREHGITVPIIVLAAFQAVLHRYTGQEDILVGAIVTEPSEPRPIGSHDETVVLRTDLSGDPSFRELLSRAARVVAEARAHEDASFEEILEQLQPERSLSHTPLFQVMFTVDGRPAPLALADCTAHSIDLHNGTARFDLTLSLGESPAGLEGTIEFNSDLFDASSIARLAGHLQTLLDGALVDPERRLSRLPLLGPAERDHMLRAWNDTAAPYPRDRCVHHLFEAQAERTPGAIAVVSGEERLTYEELNRRANLLAHHLSGLGVRPEIRVGLCVERSVEMLVGLLGVLKAGGAYVPLEPSYPAERLAFMVEDAGISVLLTQERLLPAIPGPVIRTICLDRGWPQISLGEPANPLSGATPDNLAYVIYTSGSTGRPKGVMIPHRGVVNYLWWCIHAYPVAEGGGAPVHSPLGFDLTITSLLAPLLTGRSVVLVPQQDGVDALADVLRRGRDWSLVKITPAHLEALAHSLLPADAAGCVKALIIGGEALRSEHLSFWRTHAPDTRLVNEYGPTETVVGCCVYEVPPGVPIAGAVPIGKPIANTQIHVLDAHMEPVPIGVAGELYVGGAGVGRGYLNRPELTAERFVPDPFASEPGARLYRTGDLARRRSDGTLEYLGRLDHQVKLRGFRVELGEIEAVAREHPRVRDAITLLREDRPGVKRLVTYITPTLLSTSQPEAALVRELRSALSAKLPSYMVPTSFVVLDSLPVTSNGKVDRGALPPPSQVRQGDADEPVAPADPLELQLVEIWEDLLRISPVGVLDDFFALGGDSLLAVRMVQRIEEVTGKKLPLATLFAGATIEHLARVLLESNAEAGGSPLVQIQEGGARRPFFFFHGDYNGGGFYCLKLAHHLGADQPFYALHPHGLYNQNVPLTVEAMAADYLDVLRASQPHGPYLLGGHCNGAYIAFEVARRLQADGEKVDLLVLMSASAVNTRFQWLDSLVKRLASPSQVDLAQRFDRFVTLRTRLLSCEIFLYRLPNRLVRFARAGFRGQWNIAHRTARSGFQRLGAGFSRGAGEAAPGLGYEDKDPIARTWADQRRKVDDAYTRAIAGYIPRPYEGEITVILAKDDPPEGPMDRTWGWGKVATAVQVHSVPGDHLTSLTRHADVLARQLRACLQRVAPE